MSTPLLSTQKTKKLENDSIKTNRNAGHLFASVAGVSNTLLGMKLTMNPNPNHKRLSFLRFLLHVHMNPWGLVNNIWHVVLSLLCSP